MSFILKVKFLRVGPIQKAGANLTKGGIPLDVEGVASSSYANCFLFFFQSSSLDIHLPLCVQNNSNPKRRVGIRTQRQTLHC